MSNALLFATNRRSFSPQGARAGLRSDVSSVTEIILSAWTGCGSPHFGHRAVVVADAGLKSLSATTFKRMPHLQSQHTTMLAILVSNASDRPRRELYPPKRKRRS